MQQARPRQTETSTCGDIALQACCTTPLLRRGESRSLSHWKKKPHSELQKTLDQPHLTYSKHACEDSDPKAIPEQGGLVNTQL